MMMPTQNWTANWLRRCGKTIVMVPCLFSIWTLRLLTFAMLFYAMICHDMPSIVRKRENACNEEDVAISEQIFRKLFQETQIKYPDTPPKMKTIGELRKTFREKPFTFDRLLNRIELLMDRWCDLVFDEPELNNFFFQDEEIIDEASQDVIHRLREARQALREEGQDPLEESIRLANAITGQTTVQIPRRLQTRQGDSQTERRAGSGLYKKRTTAVRLEFEENEDMDSTDQNADGTHHLSRLPIRAALEGSEDGFSPSRKKRRNSQKKKYEGRRPWSAEEKGAIIEGIREFGKGSWAMIKEKYEVLFELRTSGQIKVRHDDLKFFMALKDMLSFLTVVLVRQQDCFRSMLKRGELPADVLEES